MGDKPRKNYKNPAKDRCMTPPYAVKGLLDVIAIPDDMLLWEPAAGELDIVNALRDAGYSDRLIHSTLQADGSGDFFDEEPYTVAEFHAFNIV